jgi:phosphatidate cytidylyltransferase
MTEKKKQGLSRGGLAQRVITAVVAVPILLWVILAGPDWSWLLVVLFGTAVGLWEFNAMTVREADAPLAVMGVALGTLLVATIYYAPNGTLAMAGLVAVVLALMLTALFSFSTVERAAPALTGALGGVLYVAVFLGLLALLRREPVAEQGRYWVLLVLAVVWMGDTGAYAAGRLFGKHKLAPRVSPKKTWEGAVGGAVASVAAGFVVVAVTPLTLTPVVIVLLTLPAAVLAQMGDLCESLVKRSCGVKDSGTILYGHGGILDRIDGLLFAAPYFYLFYRITFGAGPLPVV